MRVLIMLAYKTCDFQYGWFVGLLLMHPHFLFLLGRGNFSWLHYVLQHTVWFLFPYFLHLNISCDGN